MNKKELVDFLMPFDDEIKIVVRGANKELMAPISYELSYKPFCQEHESLVIITMKGANAVNTGVSG